MEFLSRVVNGVIAFVQRHPILSLLIVIALFAPAFFGSALRVLGFFIMGIVLIIVILLLIGWWHLNRLRKEAERQFGARGQYGRGYDQRGGKKEGDVTVEYRDAHEKRVNERVGDYVDFEEIDETQK